MRTPRVCCLAWPTRHKPPQIASQEVPTRATIVNQRIIMKQLQQEFAEAMLLVEKSAGSDGMGLRVCRLSCHARSDGTFSSGHGCSRETRDIQGLFGEMPVISSPSRLDQVYFNGRCVYTNRSIPVFHTFVSQVRMVVASRSSLWRTRPWSARRRRFRQCRTWRSQNGRCWGSNRRYTAYYGILQKHMLVTVSP
jgi:hypothetical protein